MTQLLNFIRSQGTALLFVVLLFGTLLFTASAESETSSKNIFVDADQDNLSLDEEKLYGTDPNKADTDGDGYSDGVEVESSFNPLVAAPGDRVFGGLKEAEVSKQESEGNQKNLTDEVSNQIAGVLSQVSEENKEITFDQINQAVEQATGATEEVVLPEIDIKEIKIKKAPSKSLKEKERASQERQDVIEYLTVMSYIMANNSPTSFESEEELGSALSSLSNQAVMTLASGSTDFTQSLGEKGEKILEEAKKVEVPESVLDIHIKALKMGLYAASLKNELRPNGDDPLGQIAVLSRMQALLGVANQYTDEVSEVLEKYEITEIPLEL